MAEAFGLTSNAGAAAPAEGAAGAPVAGNGESFPPAVAAVCAFTPGCPGVERLFCVAGAAPACPLAPATGCAAVTPACCKLPVAAVDPLAAFGEEPFRPDFASSAARKFAAMAALLGLVLAASP